VLVAVPTVAVVAIAVTAVSLVAVHSSNGKHQQLASSHRPVPAALLSVQHLRHHRVPFNHPLTITINNGALTSVVLNDTFGQQIEGTFNRNHTRWRSSGSFTPLTRLRASVSYADLNHRVTTRIMRLRTSDSKRHLDAILSPGGGDTVGVGSPVVVLFSQDVPTAMRAAVESRLSVTSKPAVVGAWHWMNAREVHWRPPTYWKSRTKVTVTSNLEGLDLGRGTWGGVGFHSTSFKIGNAHISQVDIGRHVMRVYDNGKLIRTFPVSTGRDQYPTMDGVHIAIEKSAVVQMNSATVGILPGNPDYYNETVYWDVRISDGGEFVHAAPWSVASQGHVNVSHGCVNLSTGDAQWFYNWALRGDVIDVYDGARPPSPSDPGTADWNMSWKQWVAGDAAPTQAAIALHSPVAHLTEPGFAPASKKHHSSKTRSKHGARHSRSSKSGTNN
jgi:lipoprotein-anchoring transpeptidase ErfK/SrfK